MGMRQRLGLATALLADPPILILDEPATGLDPDGIVWLRRLARDRADQGGTVLLSSHLLGEVARIADRILMISDGRLVADAPIDEIQSAGSTLEDRFMAITSKGGRS
jgi:ABC-2 type transport system ATP-binding protein